jgi:hypothetical protein
MFRTSGAIPESAGRRIAVAFARAPAIFCVTKKAASTRDPLMARPEWSAVIRDGLTA